MSREPRAESGEQESFLLLAPCSLLFARRPVPYLSAACALLMLLVLAPASQAQRVQFPTPAQPVQMTTPAPVSPYPTTGVAPPPTFGTVSPPPTVTSPYAVPVGTTRCRFALRDNTFTRHPLRAIGGRPSAGFRSVRDRWHRGPPAAGCSLHVLAAACDRVSAAAGRAVSQWRTNPMAARALHDQWRRLLGKDAAVPPGTERREYVSLRRSHRPLRFGNQSHRGFQHLCDSDYVQHRDAAVGHTGLCRELARGTVNERTPTGRRTRFAAATL